MSPLNFHYSLTSTSNKLLPTFLDQLPAWAPVMLLDPTQPKTALPTVLVLLLLFLKARDAEPTIEQPRLQRAVTVLLVSQGVFGGELANAVCTVETLTVGGEGTERFEYGILTVPSIPVPSHTRDKKMFPQIHAPNPL